MLRIRPTSQLVQKKRPTSQQPCAKLVKTNKCNTFAMLYKFLKLALLLSIANTNVSNLVRFYPHVHQMSRSALDPGTHQPNHLSLYTK